MPYDKEYMHSFVSALTNDELKLLDREIKARFIFDKYDSNSLSSYALKLGRTPKCPHCESLSYSNDGYYKDDEKRYRCKRCGKTYSLLNNSIFNSTKKNLYTWIKFIDLMIYNVPLECIEFNLDLDHKTAFLWRHKIFSTIDTYQDNVILKDTIWLDEIYIEDLSIKRPEGLKKRGLSKYKRCIVIGIDIYKNIIAISSGNGKISTSRFNKAIKGHIKPKSKIIHDGDHSHYKMIIDYELDEYYYKANVKDKEYLEAMNLINSLSSWIKRYLYRFIGMKMKNIQSYLNWFIYLFRVKKDDEKYPMVERIIRHLLLDEGQYTRESSDS